MEFKPGVPLFSIGKQKGLWKVNDIPYYFIEFLEKGYVRLQYANKPGASWNSSSKRNFVQKRQSEVFLAEKLHKKSVTVGTKICFVISDVSLK
ncbi:hypothetical protein P9597_09465 [Aneurinibacillus migulanus]|uniref:hypothetical protein n=1 Tax=Aneurinibacillus migulanus TaxID=47500 RepID=UPI002E1F935D|nr:hypothetical protein [Aneurinibacillus migulanus]